jgi:hypothetical protein
MNAAYWEEFRAITAQLIEKLLKQWGFFNLYDDGKIASISADGKRADVYINGASVATPGIPIRPGTTVAAGDEVRVLNINFNRKDRLIDHKKVL